MCAYETKEQNEIFSSSFFPVSSLICGDHPPSYLPPPFDPIYSNLRQTDPLVPSLLSPQRRIGKEEGEREERCVPQEEEEEGKFEAVGKGGEGRGRGQHCPELEKLNIVF